MFDCFILHICNFHDLKNRIPVIAFWNSKWNPSRNYFAGASSADLWIRRTKQISLRFSYYYFLSIFFQLPVLRFKLDLRPFITYCQCLLHTPIPILRWLLPKLHNSNFLDLILISTVSWNSFVGSRRDSLEDKDLFS